jgi:hypothetical protein
MAVLHRDGALCLGIAIGSLRLNSIYAMLRQTLIRIMQFGTMIWDRLTATTPTEILEQITQTQENLCAEEDAKRQLDVVNQTIMNDIAILDQLQEELDKALHQATLDAAVGKDCDHG